MQDEFARHIRSRVIGVATILAVGAASVLSAQMPGAPVLQNAWTAPGVVGALNFDGGDGAVYAGAISWAPASARFQLSGGVGVRSQSGAGSKSVYGVRAAIPFGSATSLVGLGVFAGVGGGQSSKTDSIASNTEIPVGVAIGWRHAIGASHGLSVYATPTYVYFSGGSKAGGVARVGVGVDVGITRAFGATLGAEFGATRASGLGGPTGALYGVGISYALGRR